MSQGSILGPLLFLVYINDITDNLQTDIHLYADDAVLMCSLNLTANAINQINEDLQRLHAWSQKWHMSFNATNTKYMVISNRQNRNIYPPVQLNNTTLEQVNCFKRLGMYLDDRMTWETHINHIASVANRKIGIIWKINQQYPRKCSETFYTSYVRPILDYGCSVYDKCSRHLVDKPEAVQINAAIACTRAFRRTPSTGLLSELGWSTLEIRQKYFRLLTLYMIKSNHSPGYVRTLLPPMMGQS